MRVRFSSTLVGFRLLESRHPEGRLTAKLSRTRGGSHFPPAGPGVHLGKVAYYWHAIVGRPSHLHRSEQQHLRCASSPRTTHCCERQPPGAMASGTAGGHMSPSQSAIMDGFHDHVKSPRSHGPRCDAAHEDRCCTNPPRSFLPFREEPHLPRLRLALF